VGYEGEKMSKSKGNLVLVSRLRESGHDPRAIRLALLAHHYRRDWEWHHHEIDDATRRLERWRAAAARSSTPPAAPVVAAIREALTDDLDAPRALDAVDTWAARTGDDSSAAQDVAAAVDALLGVDV